jgi:hypothetical protein
VLQLIWKSWCEFMGLVNNGVLYLGFFSMIFDWGIKILAVYAMYLAIKAFKIYIKKNS